MEYTYFFINIGAILIPLIFSFHPKLNFYKKWKETLLSIAIVGAAFIFWDIQFTKIGIWGFNYNYLIGICLFGLPLEEWLFFITIPYACLYTYHCLSILMLPKNSLNMKWISYSLISLAIILSFIYSDQLYALTTFIFLSIVLFLIQIFLIPPWLPRFYLSVLVLIIPFTLVDGLLTGTGIESEVVWYNELHIMGPRFMTIPFEDFFYGLLLILLNVTFFEYFKKINNDNKYII